MYAQHRDQLQFNFDRQISSLEHSNLLTRLMMQPNELNVPVNTNAVRTCDVMELHVYSALNLYVS